LVKKKTVCILSLSLALFLAALTALVVFLYDEPLLPMAEKALRYQPPPVPPAENAFVSIAGLEASAERDFLQAGEENIRRANQNFQRFGLNVPEEERMRNPQGLAFSVDQYAHPCAQEISENCLEEIRADAPNIQKLLEENDTLIARYRHIQTMPEFSNAITGSMEFSPPYRGIRNLSRLLSAGAVLDIQNGNVQEGLAFIEKDLKFYRGILASREIGFIDAMMAVAQIRQHANLLALLAGQEKLHGRTDRIRALLTPLDSPKETFMNAHWREHVFITQGLFRIVDGMDAKMNPGVKEAFQLFSVFSFKENMTVNLGSEFWATEKALIDAATPAQLRDMQKEDWWESEVRSRVCTIPKDYFFCRHLKNYVGEVLAALAQPNYIDYLLRLHDADAQIRLLRARLEFARAAKSAPKTETPDKILARLGPETFNPYTGQPFDWNPEQGTIGFMPGNDKKPSPVEIRLFPIAP
jgi:hypothetical protein